MTRTSYCASLREVRFAALTMVTQAVLPLMGGGLKMVMNLSSQLGSIEKAWASHAH